MKSFHKSATFFLSLFLGMLVVTTFIAFNRRSGNTKIDMGQVHLLRSQVAEK